MGRDPRGWGWGVEGGYTEGMEWLHQVFCGCGFEIEDGDLGFGKCGGGVTKKMPLKQRHKQREND